MGTELPQTDEGQVALPPTAAEMGKPTVRGQLAEALERLVNLSSMERPSVLAEECTENCRPDNCSQANARAALDRHRAEPEGHESRCGSECPCWEAGHDTGLEAQRERVGGGTA